MENCLLTGDLQSRKKSLTYIMVPICHFIVLYGVKVAGVGGAGELGDIRGRGVADVLPLHPLKERVLLEVLDPAATQSVPRVADKTAAKKREGGD